MNKAIKHLEEGMQGNEEWIRETATCALLLEPHMNVDWCMHIKGWCGTYTRERKCAHVLIVEGGAA